MSHVRAEVSWRQPWTCQKQQSKYGSKTDVWSQRDGVWPLGWSLFKLFAPLGICLPKGTSIRAIFIMVFIMYPGRHIHLSVVLCGLMEFTLCTVIRIITPFLCHHPGIMWRPATERQAHRETALIAGKAVIRLPLILFQNDNKTLFRFLFQFLIKSRKPLSIDTSGKRALT